MPTTIFLQEAMFGPNERTLVEADTLEASIFRFESGVAAVRLRNELGELVLLPFQGQQIWSASFRGRNITMRSMFDQPRHAQLPGDLRRLSAALWLHLHGRTGGR